MAYIKEYWTNKEGRAEQARKHTEVMQRKYKNEIIFSVENTILYDVDFECRKQTNEKQTEIIIDDLDTVTAGHKHYNGKTALLNFSSYKNAGGMFINGSKAQEECLCHASYLYNVLTQFEHKFYNWNKEHKNKALYMNRALYSPSILFMCDETTHFVCDVITCACPNKSAAQKYQNVSDSENASILKSRIKFVLDIAKENNVDTLILGAYGCGVFGQNPIEVASAFKECLETTHKNCFYKVVFGIPKGRDRNLEAFKKVFN